MVLHDIQCRKCGRIEYDFPLKDAETLPPCNCRGAMEICWSTPRTQTLVTIHPSERTMVWKHPKTGKVAYPPMNNVPMPERYRKAGYERHELTSLHSVDKFCAETKTVNNKAHFNNGNGID